MKNIFLFLFVICICFFTSCASQTDYANTETVNSNKTSTSVSETIESEDTYTYHATIKPMPDIPYAGMPESEINNTKLGSYDEKSQTTTANYAHGDHRGCIYWWKNSNGHVYFAASVTDGKVDSVSKYFTNFWNGDTYIGTKLH